MRLKLLIALGAGGMSAFSGLPGGMGGLGVAGGLNPGEIILFIMDKIIEWVSGI